MNLTKMFLVARKSLVETLREPVLLIMTLGLPAFFMVINFVGFGASPKTATYPVWVIQESAQAEPYLARLKAEVYADGRPAFNLTFTNNRAAAEAALKDQRAALLLLFSEDASGQLQITSRGDALNLAFTRASSQAESILQPMLEAAQGKPQVLRVEEQPLGLARPISDFDAYAPGMMVFAILLLIPQTALLIGREVRQGTLRRLQLTRLQPIDLLGGIGLAQMAVAAVQVVVMFAMALAFGFHNRGSLVLATAIGLVLSFGAVGQGLVVACFIHNDTDALNTGSTVSMLQVFLSGAFFAMPSPTLFTLFGHQVGALDFLPSTHGMLALQQVLSGGAGLGQVAFRVGAALILSVLYFLLGVWIFSSRQRSTR
jgi:ABC-2 type transport system permease protein